MSRTINALIVMLLVSFCHSLAFALNLDCVEGKAAGKEYRGERVELPNIKKRQIMGVWKPLNFKGLTVSLDVANGTVYRVYRDRYCSSGKFGEALRKNGTRFYRRDNTAGDYFKILSDGSLGVFDKDGMIDTLPTSERLHPL